MTDRRCWFYYRHGPYGPAFEPPHQTVSNNGTRSVSCQVTQTGGKPKSTDDTKEEEKKSTRPRARSHSMRLGRGEDKRETTVFRRTASARMTSDRARVMTSELNKEREVVGQKEDTVKGGKVSLLSKIFGRKKKAPTSSGTPAPTTSSEGDKQSQEREFVTFSGQFPPPEWLWYQQQLQRRQHIFKNWTSRQLPKSVTWRSPDIGTHLLPSSEKVERDTLHTAPTGLSHLPQGHTHNNTKFALQSTEHDSTRHVCMQGFQALDGRMGVTGEIPKTRSGHQKTTKSQPHKGSKTGKTFSHHRCHHNHHHQVEKNQEQTTLENNYEVSMIPKEKAGEAGPCIGMVPCGQDGDTRTSKVSRHHHFDMHRNSVPIVHVPSTKIPVSTTPKNTKVRSSKRSKQTSSGDNQPIHSQHDQYDVRNTQHSHNKREQNDERNTQHCHNQQDQYDVRNTHHCHNKREQNDDRNIQHSHSQRDQCDVRNTQHSHNKRQQKDVRNPQLCHSPQDQYDVRNIQHSHNQQGHNDVRNTQNSQHQKNHYEARNVQYRYSQEQNDRINRYNHVQQEQSNVRISHDSHSQQDQYDVRHVQCSHHQQEQFGMIGDIDSIRGQKPRGQNHRSQQYTQVSYNAADVYAGNDIKVEHKGRMLKKNTSVYQSRDGGVNTVGVPLHLQQNTVEIPQYGQDIPRPPQYGQNILGVYQYEQAPQYGQAIVRVPQQVQNAEGIPQYTQQNAIGAAPQYGQNIVAMSQHMHQNTADIPQYTHIIVGIPQYRENSMEVPPPLQNQKNREVLVDTHPKTFMTPQQKQKSYKLLQYGQNIAGVPQYGQDTVGVPQYGQNIAGVLDHTYQNAQQYTQNTVIVPQSMQNTERVSQHRAQNTVEEQNTVGLPQYRQNTESVPHKTCHNIVQMSQERHQSAVGMPQCRKHKIVDIPQNRQNTASVPQHKQNIARILQDRHKNSVGLQQHRQQNPAKVFQDRQQENDGVYHCRQKNPLKVSQDGKQENDGVPQYTQQDIVKTQQYRKNIAGIPRYKHQESVGVVKQHKQTTAQAGRPYNKHDNVLQGLRHRQNNATTGVPQCTHQNNAGAPRSRQQADKHITKENSARSPLEWNHSSNNANMKHHANPQQSALYTFVKQRSHENSSLHHTAVNSSVSAVSQNRKEIMTRGPALYGPTQKTKRQSKVTAESETSTSDEKASFPGRVERSENMCVNSSNPQERMDINHHDLPSSRAQSVDATHITMSPDTETAEQLLPLNCWTSSAEEEGVEGQRQTVQVQAGVGQSQVPQLVLDTESRRDHNTLSNEPDIAVSSTNSKARPGQTGNIKQESVQMVNSSPVQIRLKSVTCEQWKQCGETGVQRFVITDAATSSKSGKTELSEHCK